MINIDRPEGFPLCAETLMVLNENSEMFSEWLKGIPLKNRQAVVFGDHLLVCQNLQKWWVKKGVVNVTSINQCKLVFQPVEDVTVHDNEGNCINGVWMREKADIVDENTPSAQWTILGLQDVFELNLWYDALPSFEAGLSGSLSVGTIVDGTVVGGTLTHGFDTITSIALYGDGNEILTNGKRARMKVAVRYQGRSTAQHVLQLPLPFECPDGVRMEADVEDYVSGVHYPIEAYTDGGFLRVCVGRWLSCEGLMPQGSGFANCDAIIRINKEVLL